MKTTFQTAQQSILQHGLSVYKHTYELLHNPNSNNFRLPAWWDEYSDELLKNCCDLKTIKHYTIWHDLGKPKCRTVDENGVHFPNHAEVSAQLWDEHQPNRPQVGRLIGILSKSFQKCCPTSFVCYHLSNQILRKMPMIFKITEKDKECSGIYKITNQINAKHYIGSASNFLKRYSTHLSTLKNNKHDNQYLQNAYLKHGSDQFVFEVLELCSKKDLKQKEQFYLKQLDRETMYNLTDSVNCRDLNKRYILQYSIVSPLNDIIEFKGTLKDFSEYLLPYFKKIKIETLHLSLTKIFNGQEIHYKGWRKIDNIDLDWRVHIKKRKYLGKIFNVRVISPDGRIIGPIQNIKEFCKNYKIKNSANFSRMLKKEILSTEGWRLECRKDTPLYNAKKYDVVVENEYGEHFGPIINLTQFAREHNINQSAFRLFIIGATKKYKNWKIIKPMENKTMNLKEN